MKPTTREWVNKAENSGFQFYATGEPPLGRVGFHRAEGKRRSGHVSG